MYNVLKMFDMYCTIYTVEPSVNFELYQMLQVKEFYDSIKTWTIEKFVKCHEYDHLCFTPNINTAASYALQTRFPVIISIDSEDVKDNIISVFGTHKGIHEVKISHIDFFHEISVCSKGFDDELFYKKMKGKVKESDINKLLSNGKLLLNLLTIYDLTNM